MPSAVCRFFLLGNCAKGESCPFQHEIPKEMPICEYYARGKCHFGDKCIFRHDTLCAVDKRESDPCSADPDPTPVDCSNVIIVNQEDIDCSNKTKKSTMLCPFAINSSCQDMDRCRYIHGYPCDVCGKLALHPTDDAQRKEHIKMCEEKFEKDMDECFRFQMSREVVCNICLENVIEDHTDENDDAADGGYNILPNAKKERFGLLEGCNHSFCIECIRNWRFKVESSIPDDVKRACPICRKFSGFVVPSCVWPENDEVKQKIIKAFKEKVSNIPCKYFNQGAATCPFGNSCFYKHAYPDGTLMDRSKPAVIFYDENGCLLNLEALLIADLIDDLDDL